MGIKNGFQKYVVEHPELGQITMDTPAGRVVVEIIEGLEADRDRLRKERDEALEVEKIAKSRLREVSQAIVDAIGASGPETAWQSAKRIIQQLDDAHRENQLLEAKIVNGVQCVREALPVAAMMEKAVSESLATMYGILELHPDVREIANVDNTMRLLRECVMHTEKSIEDVLFKGGE